MQKAQAEIANLEVTGESGGGMVKVIMTGRHEVKRVQIEPSVSRRGSRDARGSDRRGDQRCRASASRAATQAKMAAAMGGLSLPPGVKLPF